LKKDKEKEITFCSLYCRRGREERALRSKKKKSGTYPSELRRKNPILDSKDMGKEESRKRDVHLRRKGRGKNLEHRRAWEEKDGQPAVRGKSLGGGSFIAAKGGVSIILSRKGGKMALTGCGPPGRGAFFCCCGMGEKCLKKKSSLHPRRDELATGGEKKGETQLHSNPLRMIKREMKRDSA